MVRPALSGAARYRVHRPAILFPSLCAIVRRGSHRDRAGDLGTHQPRQSRGQYPADAPALAIWKRTNLANLEDNILPTRPRATLILKKGADHVVETVALRRL